MSTAKTSRRKPAAARAEKAKKKQPVKFEFRGVELIGPAELPGTIGFDLGDIQVRALEESGAGTIGVLQRLIEGILGRAELLKVRATIKGLGDPWQEDLLSAILEAYGAEAGEA